MKRLALAVGLIIFLCSAAHATTIHSYASVSLGSIRIAFSQDVYYPTEPSEHMQTQTRAIDTSGTVRDPIEGINFSGISSSSVPTASASTHVQPNDTIRSSSSLTIPVAPFATAESSNSTPETISSSSAWLAAYGYWIYFPEATITTVSVPYSLGSYAEMPDIPDTETVAEAAFYIRLMQASIGHGILSGVFTTNGETTHRYTPSTDLLLNQMAFEPAESTSVLQFTLECLPGWYNLDFQVSAQAVSSTVNPVPEPATLLLVGVGLLITGKRKFSKS